MSLLFLWCFWKNMDENNKDNKLVSNSKINEVI